MFRWLVGQKEGPNQLGTIQNNLGSFLLLNPDFFFLGVSEPAQKAVLVPFFWGGGVYEISPPTFFSGGVFGAQNPKI
jgi:hypothetical protein